MILTRLKEYADTRMKLPPEMYGESPVRWIIDLDSEGALLEFISRGGDSKANMRGLPMTVPQQNVNRTVNIKANLLVDNGEYVLGIPGADTNDAKVADRHQAFKELTRCCAEETREPSVEAVSKFLESWTPDRSLIPEQFDTKQHRLTFRVDGVFPMYLESVREFWAARTAGEHAPIMTCLVTGLKGPVQRRMPAHVEGLKRIGGEAKTALVSANKKPFESYGLEESLTSPISREAAERFTKALNELISKQDSHIYVGPLVYVFWTREESGFNFLGMVEQPKPEAVRLLFESPISGQQTSDVRTNNFYALALSAKKTRATVRDWLETTVPDAEAEPAPMVRGATDCKSVRRERRVLFRCKKSGSCHSATRGESNQDAEQRVQPTLVASLLRAALKGDRLPEDILARVVRRNRAEGDVTRSRVALIKLLFATQGVSMTEMQELNPDPSLADAELHAYHCGRLLAEIEAVQRAALGQVNASVTDRYYGSASSTPASVFPALMRGVRVHLGNLRRRSPGIHAALDNRIADIVAKLPDFPRTLTMRSQGLFALGYYHQRARDRAEAQAAREARDAKRGELEMSVHTDPNKRHDFVLIFDVTDGNPNGDPDAGNLPRTDPETMQGIVTDVALKRKVRNFVSLVTEDKENPERLKIFVEHRGVLNNQIRRAYTEQGMEVGKRVEKPVEDAAVLETLREVTPMLPGAFSLTNSEEDMEKPVFSYSGELSPEELKKALDAPGDRLDSKTRKFISDLAKTSGKPAKSRDNAEKARGWMCENFYDVRMFGAVMSTGLGAGQVRGPLQLTFSRSVSPVLPQDIAVTRVAVTDEKDREKEQTIGRKTLIPYGLYVGQGFFSPYLAKETGVTEQDLRLFWDALMNMWDFDRSASRGLMTPRGLYVFTHEKKLGNAPAHELFDLIRPTLRDDVVSPRKFDDYTVEVRDDLPEGVTLTRLAG